MQRLVQSGPRSREHPRLQREFVRPSFDLIVETVESVFTISTEEMRKKSRGQGRKALAQLALEDGGLPMRPVAEWLGVSDWAVSKMRRTSHELFKTDASYRASVERVRRALS